MDKLFVHLLLNWTKTDLSFFLTGTSTFAQKSSHVILVFCAILLFERDSVLTFLCAPVFICSCAGVLDARMLVSSCARAFELVFAWALVVVPSCARVLGYSSNTEKNARQFRLICYHPLT